MKSLLVVCRGNICRSPMAAGYFMHHLNGKNSSVEVISAGIAAVINHPAEIHAQKVMEKNGIDISKHLACQISESQVKKSDLILVMTHSHLNTLTRNFSIAKGKTFLLGHWQGMEIQDPHTQSYEIFEKVYQKISLAGQEWGKRILECQYNLV